MYYLYLFLILEYDKKKDSGLFILIILNYFLKNIFQ